MWNSMTDVMMKYSLYYMQFAIFTVRNIREYYYEVTLDEYNDQPIIMYSKDVDYRIGDRSVGEIYLYMNNFYIRNINGLSEKDHKLFQLCFKLRTFDGPRNGWAKQCQIAINRDIIHPYDVISDRSFVDTGGEVFPEEYNDCIVRNHAFIFGFKPVSIQYNLTNNNPEKVAKFKDNFSRHYFDSQLWKNTDLFNLEIVNIFGDYCIIRVMAYLPSRCRVIMDEAIKYLSYGSEQCSQQSR